MAIVVTGTSSGIGLEIAKYLVSQGQKVVGVSRRSTPISSDLFEHVQGDCTDTSIQKKLTEYKVTGLVLNHGVLDPVERIENADIDQWKSSFDINFFSFVSIVKTLLPQLRSANAKVVFVSSGASTGSYPTWGCYGATKAAINAFCATLAVEEPKIVAISVAPGVVDTAMQQNIREKHSSVMADSAQKFHDLHKSGQLIKPETSGKLYGNLVLNGSSDLSGKYLRFGTSTELDPYYK